MFVSYLQKILEFKARSDQILTLLRATPANRHQYHHLTRRITLHNRGKNRSLNEFRNRLHKIEHNQLQNKRTLKVTVKLLINKNKIEERQRNQNNAGHQ